MSGKIYQTQISLYFHVPFCKKKCDYCHFYVIPDQESSKQEYMEGLRLDWEKRKSQIEGMEVCSIYFGGGTPSLLGADRIGEILSWISFNGGKEVTLEANPDDISVEKMKQYAEVGINRVSIGVQSLDNVLLSVLSRQHNAELSMDAVYKVYEAGIHNISIDLMYDIPHQSVAGWKKTLEMAMELPIQHLSLYNLVFEPHTVFYKKRSALKTYLPDEASSAEMYRIAVQKCHEAGFCQYEISAFEKPGYRSKHNTGYWQGRPFLGFGPSAFSFWEGKRFQNVSNLSKYVCQLKLGHTPVDFVEELKGERRVRELLAINLRMLEGVDRKAFEHAHAAVINQDMMRSLRELEERGWLVLENDRMRLTELGTLFYDEVASKII